MERRSRNTIVVVVIIIIIIIIIVFIILITLLDAWCCRVYARTGWPDGRVICNLYLNVAARIGRCVGRAVTEIL